MKCPNAFFFQTLPGKYVYLTLCVAQPLFVFFIFFICWILSCTLAHIYFLYFNYQPPGDTLKKNIYYFWWVRFELKTYQFFPGLYQLSQNLKLSSLLYLDAVKVLEDGDLQTLGMLDYDKRLSHSFTAHPKVDPFTGKTSS